MKSPAEYEEKQGTWKTLEANVSYRKVGNIVFINISGVTASSGTAVTLGTLPEGYRPVAIMRFVSWGTTGANSHGVVFVRPNGEIAGILPSDGNTFLGTFSFPLG